MPATLAQAIPSIAFSKNPIWLKIESADYLAAAPVIAVCFLQFTAAVADAAQITLDWTINGVVMTAAAAPDNTGNQFHPATVPGLM